jgi:hypothetical protein
MRGEGLRIALAIAAIAWGPALGCRPARVPEPAEGTQAEEPGEAVCVDAPPPEARVEELTPRPSRRAVWVDGGWVWRKREAVEAGGAESGAASAADAASAAGSGSGSGSAAASSSGAWSWKAGEWVEALPGSTYVRPKLVRLANGGLAWFPGHWHTREDERKARAFGLAAVGSGSGSASGSAARKTLECPAAGG